MSIFKETFPKFIREQLKQREDTLSSGIDPLTGLQDGSRSENFFNYTLNKQCTLRLSSGVNLKEDYKIDEATGKQLAERNVLQGGIQWDDIDKKSGGLSKPIEGENGFDGAYGSTEMRSDAQDGFGIVPMPGIIDAQIRTKSAYGSLREAKVKFECHNKRQLEILEILYMRPGYHLLLEWQWSPFIDNDGNVDNNPYWNKNFFDESKSMNDLEKEILTAKEDTGGNYDAVIGYCKNFNYTVRPDGGYTCETQIIAKGEVIESIKENDAFRDQSGKKPSYAGDKPALETLITNLKNYHNPVRNPERTDNKSFATTPMNQPEDREAQKLMRWYLGVDNEYPWILPKNTEWHRIKLTIAKDKKVANRLATQQPYVRWDAFCHALNKLAPKGANGEPFYEFHTYQVYKDNTRSALIEPYRYNRGYTSAFEEPYNLYDSPYDKVPVGGLRTNPQKGDHCKVGSVDCTSDPKVAILAHQFMEHREVSSTPKSSVYGEFEDGPHSDLPHKKLLKLAEDRSLYRMSMPGGFFLDKVNNSYTDEFHRFAIGGIYLNCSYMLEKFKETYYDSNGNAVKDYSLFKFIEAVWEGVNNSTTHHDFKLSTDNKPNGTICRIIDLMDVNGDDIEGGNLENIHALKILSPDSTVRDVNYNTTLPSALSATIAIAAQAPDNVDDLDKVTFGAFNRNTTDRFNKVTEREPSQDQLNEWNQKFDEALEDFALALYSPADGRKYIIETIGVLLNHVEWYFFSDKYKTDFDEETDGNSDKNASAQERLAIVNRTQVKLEKAINVLRNSYASNSDAATEPKYYRGQIANTSPNQSSIIPLKFNAKMDGIGGIIIGNVFKLPKDKLPIGYQGDDIFFVVMGEEQKITSGQDWTTTISGHLILLGGKSNVPENLKTSWAESNKNIQYNSSYLYDSYNTKDGQSTSGVGQQNEGKTSEGGDQADHGANNNTIECERLIKGNKELYNTCKSRTGFYQTANPKYRKGNGESKTIDKKDSPRNKPRHELPSQDTCETIDVNTIMKKLTDLFIADGIKKLLAPKIAAGFCGNIKHESSYGASRYGDGGNAVGLCQWNGDRFDRLVSQYPNSWWTADSQIKHILYELKNKERKAYDFLKLCNNPKDCALIVVNRFERTKKYVNAHDAGQTYTIDGYHGNVGKGLRLSDPSASERANAAQNAYNSYVDANSGYGDKSLKRDVIQVLSTKYEFLRNYGYEEILKDRLGSNYKDYTHNDALYAFKSNYYFTKDGNYKNTGDYPWEGAAYIRVKGKGREDSSIFMDPLPKGYNYSSTSMLTDTSNLSYVHFYKVGATMVAIGLQSKDLVLPSRDKGSTHEYITTCFVEGTKVTMADGTYKNIEEVKEGDEILSYNTFIKELGVDKVLQLPKSLGSYKKIIANYEDGTKNEFSPAHPFYVEGKGWSSYDLGDKIITTGDCGDNRQENEWNVMFKEGNLYQLEVGDYCINNKSERSKIISLEETNEYVNMYNLEHLSNNKNWFANGILVKE